MATTTSKAGYRSGRDLPTVAENIELLTGQRGNKLDKAITYRELADIGLITLRKAANNALSPSVAPGVLPDDTIGRPVAPTGVIANGAFHTILVEWDLPAYKGHAHAEVWRAEEDNRAKAVMIGTSAANLYSDAIGKGASVFYWVRFVNKVNVQGPFQGVTGVHAETSRDVQDILDELQGKIEESHLAQALLGPIEQVPQLQLDIAILKPKVDEIEDKIPSIEQELAGLDERQKVAQDLLDDAQQQLGMSSIEIGLVQDRLNAKLDKYKGDFDSFRDAVFVVDPENGSITMDAVNAVRDELHTSITEVQQELDAVTGQISNKADNVTVDSQGSRITEAEQRINGLDASLGQTVTRGEFSGEQQRVTQIGQELDATKGELTQKATKQEVDAQGVRLASAESKLTVHTNELSSQAQRLDGLSAQVTQGDETLHATITELARVSAESAQVTAQRVSGLEVRAGTSEAKIQALEEIFEDDGGITAGRFDVITAELELQRGHDDDNASAAIDGALAVDGRDRETRKAFGQIITQQQTLANANEALARDVIQLSASYESVSAELLSQITEERLVRSAADQALTQKTSVLEAQIEGVDQSLSASIAEVERARANADSALAQQITTVQASAASANSAASTAQSAADQAKSDAASAAGIANGKGKVLIQSTAPAVADRLAQNLWIDTTGGANTPKRWNGTAWAAVTDKAATDAASAAATAQTTADAAKQQATTLSAAVQVQSQAIADLQNGAQAMWTAKANAGGISAGIGLIAKSDGTSQVAISASQVFVFDPNSPNALSPLFAIDNGQVIMAEAIIRTATIQILNSQQITADYVKAGVSLSAPVINGGSIVIGSNFTVTASGAMTAWSATLRYVTSHYGTFNYATINSATINSATMKNCVIEEDCTVKGTIYAEKIVGDVVKPYLLELDLSKLAGGYAWLSASVTIPSESRERKLTLMQSVVQLDYNIGSTPLEVYVKLDGVTIASYVGNPVVGVNQFLMPARIITLAAGKTVTITASIALSSPAIDRSSSFTFNPSYVLFVSR